MKYNDNLPEEQRRGLTEEEINSPEFNPEEFAPAPEKIAPAAAGAAAQKRHPSLIFGVMCAVFAVIIALFGVLSPAGSAASQRKVRESQVLSYFKHCTRAVFVKEENDCEVYAVYYKEKVAGVGFYKTVKGFSGKIEVLVLMDGANEIKEVAVISENESPGLGDRIRSESFLKQFKGLKAFEENTKIDVVSGATASSDAVTGAVKAVLESGINTFSVAKDLRAETITAEEISEDVKQGGEKTEETTGEAEETTGKGSSFDSNFRPDLDDYDGQKLNGQGGSENKNNGGGNMSADGKDVTTVYETETKESDTTDTAAPDTNHEETKAPEAVTTAPETETKAPETEPVTDPVTQAPQDTTDAPAQDTTAPDDTTAEG